MLTQHIKTGLRGFNRIPLFSRTALVNQLPLWRSSMVPVAQKNTLERRKTFIFKGRSFGFRRASFLLGGLD
jgi:hypothetical protein